MTSVSVSPATATISKGMTIQLSATVVTVGFANKAVQWSIESATGEVTKVEIDSKGLLTIPSDFGGESVTVKSTSIYDPTKSNTAVITVA